MGNVSIQRGLSARPQGFHRAQRCVGPFVSRGRHRSSDRTIRSGDVSQASTALSVDRRVVTQSPEVKAGSATDRSFRPDVQGLRAVAVMLVVLYHVGVPGLRGGFVGVDVFFVISGYVITGLLLRERLRNGSTSLRSFYARRARRILPAATLVIVGTTIASFYFLGFIAGNQEASDASTASLFVSNFHFIHLGTDYASAQAPPSPLQNFWSLAVEEQFYLIYPAVFIITAKSISRAGFEAKLGIVLSAIAASSFGWSVIETGSNPAAAYFSPLTRAWELAIGGLVAVMAPHLRFVQYKRLCAFLTWCGVGAILFSAVSFNNDTAFPGFAAAVPVVGTAAIISFGTSMPRYGAETLLSLSLAQWVGAVSFGFYLVHWPILTISEEASGGHSLSHNLLLAAAAVLICSVIYLILEKPIRHWQFLSERPNLSLGLIPLCIGISLAVVAFEQYRYYLPIHLI